MSTKTVSVLGVAWQTDQVDLLEFAASAPVPRPGAWKLQLRRDLKSPLMWILVGFAVTSLVLAVLWRQPLMAPNALVMLLILGNMFRWVARGHSESALVRGVLANPGEVRRHPLWLGHVARATVCPEATSKGVSVHLTNSDAVRLLRQNGRLEVLILHDPEAEYSPVIGWRVAG